MSGVKIGIGFGQYRDGLPAPELICEYAEAAEAIGLFEILKTPFQYSIVSHIGDIQWPP